MIRKFSLAAAVVALLTACPAPERDNPHDQEACQPACAAGKICWEGSCTATPCPAGMIWVPKPSSSPGAPPFCIAAHESSGGPSKALWTAGATPWTGVFAEQAQAACRAAGADLCTVGQWIAACEGGRTSEAPKENSPVPGDCEGATAATGSRSRCEGGYNGLFDMLGNASEWIATDDEQSRSYTTGHGFHNNSGKNDEHPCALIVTTWADTLTTANTGFRCCVPCKAGGACKVEPRWFLHQVHGSGKHHGWVENFSRMWGSSPTNVWALASGRLASYDGSKWSELRDSSLSGNNLRALAGRGDKEIWIAQDNVMKRYDLTTKTLKTFPWQGRTPELFSIADVAVSGETTWIVGIPKYGGGTGVFYLDTTGTNETWKPASNAAGTYPTAWNDGKSDEVWLTGCVNNELGLYSVSDTTGALTKKATISGSCNPKVSSKIEIVAMHGSTSSNIWIVGQVSKGGKYRAVIFHFDGKNLTPVNDKVLKAPDDSGLGSVVALTNGEVWAGGERIVHRDASGAWTWLTPPYQFPGGVWVIERSGSVPEVWAGAMRYYP